MSKTGTRYTLLFDGQCVICRYLMDTYVTPHKPKDLKVKAFQEAQFDNDYPEEKLDKCKEEIVLVDEEQQKFIGGYKAVAKVLELTKQLNWLKFILDIPFLAPFCWFGYNMVAWHRYSWIIVPPHLRCAECEIKIPATWNVIFFFILGSIILGFSGLNIYLWLETLKAAAQNLFLMIGKSNLELMLWTLLLSSIIFCLFLGIAFGAYKKVLGVNKLEVIKQGFIVNSFSCACISLVLYTTLFLSPHLASLINSNPKSVSLALSTSVLCSGIFFTGFFTFSKWQEIDFSKLKSITVLLFDSILKVLSPFIVLYFV